MPTGVKIELKGPIFKQAPQQIQKLGNRIVEDMVKKGEARLTLMLRPRPGGVYLSVAQAGKGKASTGHYRRNLNTMVSGLRGTITDGGVIYGPWLEGVGSRNATTRFKGYASFRRVGQWMESQRRRVTEFHVNKLVRELNGS